MNKTKIEWTDYTWNPVTGCRNACSYCYARKIAKRFTGHFRPTFHQKRLSEPGKVREDKQIFVCSMADLFGEWIPKKWIDAVIGVTRENPQHVFSFLTKNPIRYYDFKFPSNCFLGATVDMKNQDRVNIMRHVKNFSFLSFEPLLSDMSGLDLTGIDWCIVGTDSSPGAKPVPKMWVESIKHKNIFYKTNLRTV